MLDLFSEMAESILDQLGEDAFFDGATTTIKINIEHGVQLAGIGGEEAQYRGDLVANRDVATILSAHNPDAGKRFVFKNSGKAYRLEFLVEDTGATRRFVVMADA